MPRHELHAGTFFKHQHSLLRLLALQARSPTIPQPPHRHPPPEAYGQHYFIPPTQRINIDSLNTTDITLLSTMQRYIEAIRAHHTLDMLIGYWTPATDPPYRSTPYTPGARDIQRADLATQIYQNPRAITFGHITPRERDTISTIARQESLMKPTPTPPPRPGAEGFTPTTHAISKISYLHYGAPAHPSDTTRTPVVRPREEDQQTHAKEQDKLTPNRTDQRLTEDANTQGGATAGQGSRKRPRHSLRHPLHSFLLKRETENSPRPKKVPRPALPPKEKLETLVRRPNQAHPDVYLPTITPERERVYASRMVRTWLTRNTHIPPLEFPPPTA